jgi:hypothetical protein
MRQRIRGSVVSLLLAGLFVGVLTTSPVGARTNTRFQSSGLKSSVGDLPGATDQATGVSCVPGGPCIAVDYSGQFYALSGNHVAALGAVGIPTFGISCTTQSFCAVVSDDAVAILRATRITGYPLLYSPQSNTHWQSISCPRPTFCMAGGGVIGGPQDGAGVVASWNGVAWSGVQVVLPDIPADPKTQISSMTCTSATFCVAGDQNERTLQWDGKNWSSPKGLKDLGDSFAVSCTSRTFCLAFGSVTNATLTWNGRSWRYRDFDGINDYGVVSCRSPVNCVAVDGVGQAQRWNANGWEQVATVEQVPQDFVQAISCSSDGFCEAVTSMDRFIYLYDPHAPPRLPILCTSFDCKPTKT